MAKQAGEVCHPSFLYPSYSFIIFISWYRHTMCLKPQLICSISFHSSSTSWSTFSTPWRLRFHIDQCPHDPWAARIQWATPLSPASPCSRCTRDLSPPATTNASRDTSAKLTGSARLILDPRASFANSEREYQHYLLLHFNHLSFILTNLISWTPCPTVTQQVSSLRGSLAVLLKITSKPVAGGVQASIAVNSTSSAMKSKVEWNHLPELHLWLFKNPKRNFKVFQKC